MNNTTHNQSAFECIKKLNREKGEYWSARQLAKLFDYSEYRHFLPVIKKAREACQQSNQAVGDHFEEVLDMVQLGSGASRKLEDVQLSRYACYLIVQNADASKPIVALGQTYFAIQTRRQELSDDANFKKLQEDEKRLFLRNELKIHNKKLVETAKQAGVETTIDFAIFQNHGYKGLYGGLDVKGIHKQKKLKKNEQILDHMGATELAANLFRATQAEEKLRRDEVKEKKWANQTHFEVGVKVRETIKELGGAMPESLPNPEVSAKKLKKPRMLL